MTSCFLLGQVQRAWPSGPAEPPLCAHLGTIGESSGEGTCCLVSAETQRMGWQVPHPPTKAPHVCSGPNAWQLGDKG